MAQKLKFMAQKLIFLRTKIADRVFYVHVPVSSGLVLFTPNRHFATAFKSYDDAINILKNFPYNFTFEVFEFVDNSNTTLKNTF